MRTYGRIENELGVKTWVTITTDDAGFNDNVYITTLIQCLLLILGESPFHANYGIPAQQSLVQQVFPDFYVAQTQQQFSGFFSNLMITKEVSANPLYRVNVVRNTGAKSEVVIPI